MNDQAEIMESISARGHPRGCYDVVNGRGLVQPGRLQNLSLLGGARGDVMNGHWCDQAEIMETIAAQGRPRGCYECWPGTLEASIVELVDPAASYNLIVANFSKCNSGTLNHTPNHTHYRNQ